MLMWIGLTGWPRELEYMGCRPCGTTPRAGGVCVKMVVSTKNEELLNGRNRPQGEEGLPPAKVRPGCQI